MRARASRPLNSRLLLPLAACWVLAGGALAAVLSGGIFELARTLSLSAGGSARAAGGPFTVAHSVGQPNASAMTGGAFQLVSGFHRPPLSLPAPQGSLALSAASISEGLSLGVASTATLTITFNQPMDAASILAAASVSAIRFAGGQAVYSTAAFSAVYDAATASLAVTPAPSWGENTLFEFSLSTHARSIVTAPLASPFAKRWRTLFIAAQENTLTDSAAGQTSLLVGAGSFSDDGYAVIKTDPVMSPDRVNPQAILQANAKIVSVNGAVAEPVAIREINAYDAAGRPTQLRNPAALSLAYQEDAQGMALGTRVRASRLAIWTLDESRNLWIRIPGSVNDRQAKVVRAVIPHLSVYALIGTADTEVSQAYAFPVPWKPRAGNPARYGSAAGITFANIPSEGSIRIYTVSGSLVRELPVTGTLTLQWPGNNEQGSEVASGVYLWELRSGNNRKTGRLMVVW